MLYSKTAHANGGTGFFFDSDKNAPADSIKVADADVAAAINLPSGYAYDFDAAGKLVTTAPTAAQIQAVASAKARADLQAQAMAALDKTDIVCLRCFKAGVAFPAAWQSYTQAIRAISNGTDTTSTTLPTMPAYPAGT